MTRKARAETLRLLQRLASDPSCRLARRPDGAYSLASPNGGTPATVPAGIVRALIGSGLLRDVGAECVAVSELAEPWLRRQAGGEDGFRAQHQNIEPRALGETGGTVSVNTQESPVAALARRAGRDGKAWLAPHAVEAAERLRRDFEVGQLQPRVTSNWSATVNTGRRTDGAGSGALTDMALAARIRVDHAIAAVGPEFSGVLLDICCFLKGLEIVERERLWPVRSAKLVLRLGLEALARHYGLQPAASGPDRRGNIRHWGAQGFRPELVGNRQ